MKSEELKSRWSRDHDSRERTEQITRNFRKGKRNIVDEQVDGLYDLRGFSLAGTADRPLVVRKNHFVQFDFSFAEITNTVWKDCRFDHCIFHQTFFKDSRFINCRFSNLTFSGCRFITCGMANNAGPDSGVYDQVVFEDCTLTRTDFNFPVIRSCRFINNSYNEVDFDGSRFYDCVFEGRMDEVEFRGYSVLANLTWLGVLKRIDPKKFRNPMENVDFRLAPFRYVGFSHNIDLRKCLFALDENNFLIKNPAACFSKARSEIEAHWDSKDKKRALHTIDLFLFPRNHENMPVVFFYRRPSVDNLKEFDDKLFALIKKISDQIQ